MLCFDIVFNIDIVFIIDNIDIVFKLFPKQWVVNWSFASDQLKSGKVIYFQKKKALSFRRKLFLEEIFFNIYGYVIPALCSKISSRPKTVL